MKKIELMLEAERRGILPADKQVMLDEARNRGLVRPAKDTPAGTHVERFDPTQGMSTTDKFLAGTGKAFVDTGRGVRQLYAWAADAIDPITPTPADLAAGRNPARSAVIQREIDEAKRLDAPLMDTGAGLAGNIGGHIVLSLAPGKAISASGKALSLPSLVRAGKAINNADTFKKAAAFGAGYSAIQPVASDESRLANTALGATGAVAGQAVGKTIGRALRPVRSTLTDSSARVGRRFEALGGKLTPGQRSGSTALQQLEAGMESFPPTAGAMAKIKRQNQTVLNRVAAKAIGESADDLNESVLGRAYTRIGRSFELAKRDAVALGDDFLEGLARIDAEYQGVWGGKGDAAFKSIMDDALEDAGRGAIDGGRYTRLRSDLSKRARDAFSQQNSRLGQAIEGMIDVLDDAAEKSIPKEKALALAEARRQWATLRTLEKSLNGENVSGTKLANRLRTRDPKGFTYGFRNSDLYAAARFADRFKPLVGDSGTATRMGVQMLGGGIAGSGVAALTGQDPAAGLAYGLGAPLALRGAQGAYLSKPAQAYLSRGLLGLPPAVERGLMQGTRGVGLLGLPVLMDAGND